MFLIKVRALAVLTIEQNKMKKKRRLGIKAQTFYFKLNSNVPLKAMFNDTAVNMGNMTSCPQIWSQIELIRPVFLEICSQDKPQKESLRSIF